MNLHYSTYSYFGESRIWLGKILANAIHFTKFAKVFSPTRILCYMVHIILFLCSFVVMFFMILVSLLLWPQLVKSQVESMCIINYTILVVLCYVDKYKWLKHMHAFYY